MRARRALALIGRFGPAALVVAALIAFFASGLYRHVSIAELRERREGLEALVSAHPALSLGVYLLAYVVLVGLSVPAALVLTVTGGFLFGPFIGGVAAASGATLGAGVIFLICRRTAGDVLRRRAGAAAAQGEDGVRANAFLYLVTLRLIPVFPFWLANLATGLVAIPLRTLLAGTFVGILPLSVVYAALGWDLHAVFRRGEPVGLSTFERPEVLIPLGLLALLSLAPIVVRKLRARGSKEKVHG